MLINKELIGNLVLQVKHSPRLRMNYNFHILTEESIQRMLNAIEPGSVIPISRHKDASETIIIIQGSIRIVTYNDEKYIIEGCILDKSTGNIGYHIPKGIWHKVKYLESDTVIS